MISKKQLQYKFFSYHYINKKTTDNKNQESRMKIEKCSKKFSERRIKKRRPITMRGIENETKNKQISKKSSSHHNKSQNICAACLFQITTMEQDYCVTECKHHYHEKCLEEWLKQKNTCCLCRQKIKKYTSKNKGQIQVPQRSRASFFDLFMNINSQDNNISDIILFENDHQPLLFYSANERRWAPRLMFSFASSSAGRNQSSPNVQREDEVDDMHAQIFTVNNHDNIISGISRIIAPQSFSPQLQRPVVSRISAPVSIMMTPQYRIPFSSRATQQRSQPQPQASSQPPRRTTIKRRTNSARRKTQQKKAPKQQQCKRMTRSETRKQKQMKRNKRSASNSVNRNNQSERKTKKITKKQKIRQANQNNE